MKMHFKKVRHLSEILYIYWCYISPILNLNVMYYLIEKSSQNDINVIKALFSSQFNVILLI